MLKTWWKTKGLMISNIVFIFSIIFVTIWYLNVVSNLERKLTEPEPVTIYRYVDTNDCFDTSALSQWCGDASLGRVRMLGGWLAPNGKGVEDEQGNVWNVEGNYTNEDYLLLWIADNGTVEDVADDVVVKVWREV